LKRTPLSQTTDILKALANPSRLRILAILQGGELCVCQISGVLGLAASTVSAHLSDLRKAGLLLEQKRAKFVYYSLSPDPAAVGWQRLSAESVLGDSQIVADHNLVSRIRSVPAETFAAEGMASLPVHP
jgi:DNA-binding transcriptional ArsR family regulator